MTTIEISLPGEMWAFIETQRAREGHASASECIRALIREAQIRRARQELETKLLEGLEGREVEMDRADWDSIKQEALEGLARETLRP